MPLDPLKSPPNWRDILKLLDCPTPQVLPGSSRCPICQKLQLSIFDDFANSGQWSFCFRCNSGTDLVRLAAKAWGLSIAATIHRIRRAGIATKGLHDDPAYEKTAQAYSQSLAFYREASLRKIEDSPSAAKLAQQLGWTCRVPIERIKDTTGSLFGWMTKREIESFQAYSDYHRAKSNESMLYGQGWEDCLVVPFRDLPGRLCGILAIGRNADPHRDYLYKALTPGFLSMNIASTWVEAGLSMHPKAILAGRRWTRKIIAIRDIPLGLKLQCMQLERDPMPLPIALWHNRRYPLQSKKFETKNSWIQLHKRTIVFWMPTPCGVTMAQAIKQNAFISMASPPLGVNMDSYLGYRAPDEVAGSIFEEAKSWRATMVNLLAQLDESQLEEFLVGLEEEGISVKDLGLPSQAQVAANVVVGETSNVKTATYHGMTVMEQNGALYRLSSKHKPELLFGASINITHAIHQPTEGRVIYKGIVTYNGESIPFTASENEIERRCLSYVRDLLLAKRKGVVTFAQKYDSAIFHIAMQFSKHEYVTGLDMVGWNAIDRKFVFPSFAITANGSVEQHDRQLFLEGAPCWDWRAPSGLAAEDIELISESNGVLWALAAAMIANIIAPATNFPSHKAIGVCGTGAIQTALKFVSGYGGEVTRVATGNSGPQKTYDRSIRHGCPTYVDNTQISGGSGKDSESAFRHFLAAYTPNTFVPLTSWQSVTKQLDEDWLVVNGLQPASCTEAKIEALSNVVSCYIEHFCKNHLSLPEGDCLIDAVIDDLTDFASSISKSGKSIGQCKEFILGRTQGARAEAFAEAISEMILSGDIKYAEKPSKNQKCIVATDRELYVPKKLFGDYLLKQAGIRPNTASITNSLAGHGSLIGETNGCWIVDGSWWLEIHRRHSAIETRMLKIIG